LTSLKGPGPYRGCFSIEGVEEEPYPGGSVEVTVELAAGESDITSRVRQGQSAAVLPHL
jgi:hypothetical protein